MSIALERRNGIGGSGLSGGIPCFPIYESPEGRRIDRRAEAAAAGREAAEESFGLSIGRNSDCLAAVSGSDGEESGETEVQSRYKGPLETMDALEESLPIRYRRLISGFSGDILVFFPITSSKQRFMVSFLVFVLFLNWGCNLFKNY